MIALSGVGKRYRPLFGGPVLALDDVTLDVPAGEVLGIAGPNGAGKSTLLAILLGFLRPTAGTVRIAGLAPRDYVEAHGVGLLPELVHAPKGWRADQALARYAVLSGVRGPDVPAAVERVLDRLGLQEHRAKRLKALSKGTLQRLALAQALLGAPRLLVFDEPTHGLDPVWTHDFRTLVAELRAPDRTILVASHNLDELQRVADRVAILDRGRVRRLVDTRAGDAGAGVYRLVVHAGLAAVRDALPAARDAGEGALDVPVASLVELNAAVAHAIARGAVFAAVAPSDTVLETAFRESVTTARDDARADARQVAS